MQSSETNRNKTFSEWFDHHFPTVSDICLTIRDVTVTSYDIAKEKSPWWFDCMHFLVLMVCYEYLLPSNYTWVSLGWVSLFCFLLFERLERKPGIPPVQNDAGRFSQGISAENCNSSEQKQKLANERFINFILAYGISYYSLEASVTFVRLEIFLFACRPGLIWMHKQRQNKSNEGWKLAVSKLASDILPALNAPEERLISLMNEKLDKEWPVALVALGKFLETTFSQALRFRSSLITFAFYVRPGTLPGTDMDSFKVTSVKVQERESCKVVLDVNTMYNGFCPGGARWPTLEEYKFRSYQLDAEFRLELHTVTKEVNYVMHENVVKMKIHLKKVNDFNTSHDLMCIPGAATDQIRARFITGVLDVLLLFFPFEVQLQETYNDVSQGSNQQSVNNQQQQPITTRVSSSQQHTPTSAAITSPPAGTRGDTSTKSHTSGVPPVEITPLHQTSTTESLGRTETPQVLESIPPITSSSSGDTSGTNSAPLSLPFTGVRFRTAANSQDQGSRPQSSPSFLAEMGDKTSESSGHASIPQQNPSATSRRNLQATAISQVQRSRPPPPYSSNIEVSSTTSSLDKRASAPNIGPLDPTERTKDNFVGLSQALRQNPDGAEWRSESTASAASWTSSEGTSSSQDVTSVELTTRFQPPQTLLVTVHKIKNLPLYKGKIPQPYIKLVLQSPGKPDQKETTDIQGKTTEPIFEKSFSFQLDRPLSGYTLTLTAKTKFTLHHALCQVMLRFVQTSNKVSEVRRWYDLSSPKGELKIHRVEY